MKLKEVKFRPRTEKHDLEYKTRHVREFLDKGHRVRLVVQFRGREQAHPEYGQKVLDAVIAALPYDVSVGPVKMDGRNMFCEVRP